MVVYDKISKGQLKQEIYFKWMRKWLYNFQTNRILYARNVCQAENFIALFLLLSCEITKT